MGWNIFVDFRRYLACARTARLEDDVWYGQVVLCADPRCPTELEAAPCMPSAHFPWRFASTSADVDLLVL